MPFQWPGVSRKLQVDKNSSSSTSHHHHQKQHSPQNSNSSSSSSSSSTDYSINSAATSSSTTTAPPSEDCSRPLPAPPSSSSTTSSIPFDDNTNINGWHPQRQRHEQGMINKRSSSLAAPAEQSSSASASTATASSASANVHPGHQQSVFAELSQRHNAAGPPLNGSSSDTLQQRQHRHRGELPQLPEESRGGGGAGAGLAPSSNTHARPLSSYTRDPLPGVLPPSTSNAGAPPIMTSPSSSSSLASNNGNAAMTRAERDNTRGQPSDDAQVSAQILNLANMIVSPVPQRGAVAAAGRPPSAVMLNSADPQQQQSAIHRHPPQHHRMHNGENDYDDDELTMEEAQEMALSTSIQRMPSLPGESNNDQPSRASFSIIDDPQAAARLRTSSSSSSQHARQASSDESSPHRNSPPKPKLRNLDTSMLAARSKVSSFFGGLSDSLASAGGHQQQRQHNSTSGIESSSSPYSSHPSYHSNSDTTARAIPHHREASPQPHSSSSYPSTSHMQPPPSSVAQSRSHSQPLQHQEQIPQYAVAQQHGQQPSISSTATGSSSTNNNLHPRSSFYGLDAHVQSEDAQQPQRWRGERRASPSTIGTNSRTASRSMPRSDTGHHTSPSLGGASLYGGYAASNEASAPTRRRVTSWATRSNTSSVYGLSMTSPQLAPSTSGDLPPVPTVPHLTQAHLRPGQGVSLLSHQKTLDMYRANVKKTNDPEVTFELAQFMLGLAREMAIQEINNAQLHPLAPGISDENLLSSLNGGGGNQHHNHNHNGIHDGDSSPSPDPSISFHSRSSGSSGDLASAAAGLAANGRAQSSQGLSHQHHHQQQQSLSSTTGLQRRRGSHSPSPSISTTARLSSAIGIHRTGSPTSANGNSSVVNDRKALVAEALSLLKRSADRGHIASQYFLADIYANGGVESQKSNARASIYSLLPGGGGGGSHAATGQNGSSGSGNVSPLDTRMNPSPTGSAASLTAPNYFNNNMTSTSLSPNPSSSAAHSPTNYQYQQQQQSQQKPDYDRALPLFIAAAKHGHAPSSYRAGECFENGWGCRKDSNKAVQFYRKSAASSFPEAMYRLGMAELNGELGLKDRQKEGFKWLKQVAALAESSNSNDTINNNSAQDGSAGYLSSNGFSSSPSYGGAGGFGLTSEDMMENNNNDGSSHSNQGIRLCTVQALHELALLHERGIDNVVFIDNEYAAELLARASELGYAPSAYKLGECYEYGRMGCPQDAALSIHYYNIAAQQNHREACFALTAWYLVGSPGVLPQSDTEAYLWAKKAAEQGLAKAEYAVGYFTEVGIGTIKDERDAIQWFRKAAEHGDKRAITRLRTLGVNTDNLPQSPTSPRSAKTSAGGGGGGRRRSHKPSSNAPPLPTGPMSAVTPDHRRSSEGINGKEGQAGNKNKRRSRRSTLPGLMGMTNKEERQQSPPPPLPNDGQHVQNGKKADGDCIIS